MKWTAWVFSFVAAAVLMAGCGGERQGNEAGTAGEGTETGTMQGDAGLTSDTALQQSGETGSEAAPADTAQGGTRLQPDTNNPATGSDTASRSTGDTVRPSGDTATNPSQ